MLYDPIEQRPFKTNVVADFLALQPLMAEDLLTLGQELLVQQGLPYEFLFVFLQCTHAILGQNSDFKTHESIGTRGDLQMFHVIDNQFHV